MVYLITVRRFPSCVEIRTVGGAYTITVRRFLRIRSRGYVYAETCVYARGCVYTPPVYTHPPFAYTHRPAYKVYTHPGAYIHLLRIRTHPRTRVNAPTRVYAPGCVYAPAAYRM